VQRNLPEVESFTVSSTPAYLVTTASLSDPRYRCKLSSSQSSSTGLHRSCFGQMVTELNTWNRKRDADLTSSNISNLPKKTTWRKEVRHACTTSDQL